MASPLSPKHREQISAALAASEFIVETRTDWAPDLVVFVEGCPVTFHAKTRDITVSGTTLSGDDFKGVGFAQRMVDAALEIAESSGTDADAPQTVSETTETDATPAVSETTEDPAPPSPTEEELATAPPAAPPPLQTPPAPPKSLNSLNLPSPRPRSAKRPHRRIERDGVVLHSGG